MGTGRAGREVIGVAQTLKWITRKGSEKILRVAFEVARRLHAPLDVFVVRKLGVPGCEELAMGAIASGGVRVCEKRVGLF